MYSNPENRPYRDVAHFRRLGNLLLRLNAIVLWLAGQSLNLFVIKRFHRSLFILECQTFVLFLVPDIALPNPGLMTVEVFCSTLMQKSSREKSELLI